MGQLVIDNLNIKSIKNIGKILSAHIKPKDIIIFTGPLGSGKTTLIKEICKGLNTREKASSPSFTIINKYHGKFDVLHIDFYRLNKFEEVNDLDLEDIFLTNNIVFIEWADSFLQLLPKHHLEICFSIKTHLKRKLIFKSFCTNYNNIIKYIKNEYSCN